MTPMRVACVGAGFIAGRHVRALATIDDVEVVAVADPDLDRAEALAATVGARSFADPGAVLELDPLDAVWFCVPPYAHGALELAAIDRGLPFFVEKPLAHDLDTAHVVASALEGSSLVVGVGYHWRALPIVGRAAEVLAGSPPVLVTGAWLDRTPAAPWWADRARSGGQVVEQATHLFDLARVLVGEVDDVQAFEAVAEGGPALAPAASVASLRFTSGAVGSIASARVLAGRHRVVLRLVGEGYAVELAERSLDDHELRVTTRDGTATTQLDDDPVLLEDRAFLDVLRGRRDRPLASYDDALATHRLAWAADLSARNGAGRA